MGSREQLVTRLKYFILIVTEAAAATPKTATDWEPVDITLLSTDRQHVVNVGDSLTLDCRFHAFSYNLFDYPVLWRKRQLDEDVQVH